MQPDQTEPALSADEFFDLVDRYLTPPIAALGYHRIHGSVNDQPGSRTTLSSMGATPEDTQHRKVAFLWFEFGFEAGSEEVKRLVGPEDPDSEDEWWVNYEPSTGRLELENWRPVAGARVDWDVWRDDGPCSVDEVHRRLGAVGKATLAFVQLHGGFPVRP
jgi:hypothetical protein